MNDTPVIVKRFLDVKRAAALGCGLFPAAPCALALRGKRFQSALGASWQGVALAATLLAGGLLHAATAPEIFLSLQGVADETIEQGEPLRVTVRIEAPEASKVAWTLAPASGTWADAVAVEILPEGRDEAAARGGVVGAPDQPHAVIDPERVAGGLWRFAPEVMQRLAPGNYRLRAKLTVRDGTGWQGTAESDVLTLTVIASSGTPERAGLKALALARDALLIGEIERAATLLDGELTRDPQNFRALLLRAAVAERAGNVRAAQLCLNAARASAGEKRAGYPNVELEELSRRVAEKLIRPADGSARADPPMWSWPPDSVVRALRAQ